MGMIPASDFLNKVTRIRMSKKTVLNTTAIGGAGLAVLYFLISVYGFNGDSYNHDSKFGIEFAMQFDALEHEGRVWIHVPNALYIQSKLSNLIKTDRRGRPKEARLSEFFPIAGSTEGTMDMSFEIQTTDEDKMPDLRQMNQGLVPLVYILRDHELPAFIRYMIVLCAFGINNWAFFKVAIVVTAIAFIVIGVGLRIRNRKRNHRFIPEMNGN